MKARRDLFVIVVAAGEGTRLGLGVRKAHVEVAGRPLLAWSIPTFERHPAFRGGVVVVHEDDQQIAAQQWIQPFTAAPGNWQVVAGGATRAGSVRSGLAVAGAAEWVAVHDAARPLLSGRDLERVVEEARRCGGRGGAILAHPVSDTVKRVAGGRVVETVDRRQLVGAETPQVFPRALLIEAHQHAAVPAGGPSHAQARSVPTDDASVVEMIGGEVAVVLCHDPNPKLTGPQDLRAIEACIDQRS